MVLDEEIKNAICNNDEFFFEKNLDRFSIDYRFTDENNDTLLLYSISDPLSNLYHFFLSKNANIKLLNDEYEGVFHAIIFSGDKERLIEILNDYPELDMNIQSKDGATPLLLAVSLDKIEIAEILIEKGADVKIPDIEGITPLHLAVQLPNDNADFVKILLLNGADPFLKTKNGNLALALAINSENTKIIKLLFSLMYGSV